MRNATLLKLSFSLSAFVVLANCASSPPSQAALDACGEQVGLETKLIVVTAPDGSQSISTDPPGQTIDAGQALELKRCTDSYEAS